MFTSITSTIKCSYKHDRIAQLQQTYFTLQGYCTVFAAEEKFTKQTLNNLTIQTEKKTLFFVEHIF